MRWYCNNGEFLLSCGCLALVSRYNFQMRLALISDIHGNLPALEAVLEDVRGRGVDEVVCLGDVANVGPYPAGCIDLLREQNIHTLQGNHELYLLGEHVSDNWETTPEWAPVRWSLSQLTPDHLAYMRDLPVSRQLDDKTYLFHASPINQFLGFLPHYGEAEYEERMAGLDDVTVFVGHTHRALYRAWSRSRIVNGGSVGMPLDGTPHAKYVVITQHKSGWHVEFRQVDYDIMAVMRDYDRLGLQAYGGVIVAVFRHQILTGVPLASPYLKGLRAFAEVRGESVAEAIGAYPVPPEVAHWCDV